MLSLLDSNQNSETSSLMGLTTLFGCRQWFVVGNKRKDFLKSTNSERTCDLIKRNVFSSVRNKIRPLSYPFYLCLPATSAAFVCHPRIPCSKYRIALAGLICFL